MNYLNINLPWNFFKIWDFKRRVMMKKNLCLLFQLLNSSSFPIILYVFSFANYLLVVAFWSIPTVTTSLVLRVSWLVRPAEILLLSYSSLALDFSFFVLVFSSSQAYYISALYRSNCPINMVVELLPYVGASRSRGTIFKESFCWGTASRHRWRLVKQLDLDFWNSARQDQRTNVRGRGTYL